MVANRALRPEGYSICTAMQAVEHFCKEHGADLASHTVVEIALAWRERKAFEWTPCAKGFRRIIFCDPEHDDGYFVKVFDYQGFSAELTKELDELIKRFLDGRWYE